MVHRGHQLGQGPPAGRPAHGCVTPLWASAPHVLAFGPVSALSPSTLPQSPDRLRLSAEDQGHGAWPVRLTSGRCWLSGHPWPGASTFRRRTCHLQKQEGTLSSVRGVSHREHAQCETPLCVEGATQSHGHQGDVPLPICRAVPSPRTPQVTSHVPPARQPTTREVALVTACRVE